MQKSVCGLKNGRQRGIFSLLATVSPVQLAFTAARAHCSHLFRHLPLAELHDFPRHQRKECPSVKGPPSSLPDIILFPLLEGGCNCYLFHSSALSPISTTFQLPLSKNIPDVAKQQNSHESTSGWQMSASISCRRKSLTSITHHFLRELVLREYFENPSQHVKISK